MWVRGAGELLPASALVAEHHSSTRGSAATGRLRRRCEGIPGCAQANGMGLFSGQHLDLDVTRGAPRFHDATKNRSKMTPDRPPQNLYGRPRGLPGRGPNRPQFLTCFRGSPGNLCFSSFNDNL